VQPRVGPLVDELPQQRPETQTGGGSPPAGPASASAPAPGATVDRAWAAS
jgi:hypothetical protein